MQQGAGGAGGGGGKVRTRRHHAHAHHHGGHAGGYPHRSVAGGASQPRSAEPTVRGQTRCIRYGTKPAEAAAEIATRAKTAAEDLRDSHRRLLDVVGYLEQA